MFDKQIIKAIEGRLQQKNTAVSNKKEARNDKESKRRPTQDTH